MRLDYVIIAAAVQQWRHRLTSCVKASGGHSEIRCNSIGLNQWHVLSRQIIVFVYVLRLYSLSPFKRPFPDGSGLAGTRMSPFWILLELRMTEMVSGDNWSYKTCKAPVKYHHQQTNIQFSLQAGCPSCHPANSVKALKRKYHIPWTCLPQLTWGSSNFVSDH